jgi:hypothetical protein
MTRTIKSQHKANTEAYRRNKYSKNCLNKISTQKLNVKIWHKCKFNENRLNLNRIKIFIFYLKALKSKKSVVNNLHSFHTNFTNAKKYFRIYFLVLTM